MDVIYDSTEVNIYKQNTLIVGATSNLKKKIKKKLKDTCTMVDNTFSYSCKTIGEVVDIYSFNVSNIDKLNKKNIDELTFDEYYYLALLIKISLKPKVLIVDNLFGYLNNRQKAKIIGLAKRSKVTLIIFDNELYDVYQGFDVIVIHNNQTAVQGQFKDVVLQEKILKRLGYELPFYVDLSIQLKLFGLIDDIYYTQRDLEGNLWK